MHQSAVVVEDVLQSVAYGAQSPVIVDMNPDKAYKRVVTSLQPHLTTVRIGESLCVLGGRRLGCCLWSAHLCAPCASLFAYVFMTPSSTLFTSLTLLTSPHTPHTHPHMHPSHTHPSQVPCKLTMLESCALSRTRRPDLCPTCTGRVCSHSQGTPCTLCTVPFICFKTHPLCAKAHPLCVMRFVLLLPIGHTYTWH